MPHDSPTAPDARTLIDRAWRARYEAIKRPPEDETELRRVVERVRADLVAAADICRANGDMAELSVALGKLGHVEHTAEAKLKRYVEAVAAARGSGDPLRIAHAVRHLGDVHRNGKRLQEAEICYEEALALYREHESSRILDYANALRPMAILKAERSELDEAKSLWQQAGALYGVVGIDAGVEEAEHWLERLEQGKSYEQ